MRLLALLLPLLTGTAAAAELPLSAVRGYGYTLASLRMGASCAQEAAGRAALRWAAQQVEADLRHQTEPRDTATALALADETQRRHRLPQECATLLPHATLRATVWLHSRQMKAEITALEAERDSLLAQQTSHPTPE